jgi:hypothetical protein
MRTCRNPPLIDKKTVIFNCLSHSAELWRVAGISIGILDAPSLICFFKSGVF